MAAVSESKGNFRVKAYAGDNKTLLAFNFDDPTLAKNLAGFTIACKLPGQDPAFYLFNFLKFESKTGHAFVKDELATSTVNAPIQKYRWVDFAHAPKSGGAPVAGNYVYTVTPRYFDGQGHMLSLDDAKSVSVTIPVGPFVDGLLKVGFTRGYMQSQAYARHFGPKTKIEPANRPFEFDTSANAGTNSDGRASTYVEIYEWMGATARQRIYELLDMVKNDTSLKLLVFAYDLDEPDIVAAFLALAASGRIRIILDSAQLHITHDETNKKTGKTTTVVPLEDDFEAAFNRVATEGAEIKRGCFDRYSHDKVFIVTKDGLASTVLTGSTNFSVTGVYVNANHVLVFEEPTVAQYYAKVFEESWTVLISPKASTAIAKAFATSSFGTEPFVSATEKLPKFTIHFSPHTKDDVTTLLSAIQKRILSEESAINGNVLFAVMQLTRTQSPVCQALIDVHNQRTLFSYGISDSPGGVKLYAPGSKNGVLVTGKPSAVILPPPFNAVATLPGHEIHHKFVVCGVNGKDPVVWCGSSNLATGGEAANGDNLLEIHDAEVAMAFAIEALLLVDQYNFLDRYASPPKTKAPKAPRAATTASGSTAIAKKAVKRTVAKTTVAKKRAAKKAISLKRRSASTALVLRQTMAHMVAPAKNSAENAPARKQAAGEVTQMPQSQEKAAEKAGIFLYTNDTWSLRYFDPNDLHFLERELFG